MSTGGGQATVRSFPFKSTLAVATAPNNPNATAGVGIFHWVTAAALIEPWQG